MLLALLSQINVLPHLTIRLSVPDIKLVNPRVQRQTEPLEDFYRAE